MTENNAVAGVYDRHAEAQATINARCAANRHHY
jgi:hypothetical protein